MTKLETEFTAELLRVLAEAEAVTGIGEPRLRQQAELHPAGITARLLLRQIWTTIFRFNEGLYPKGLRILLSGVSLF